MALTVSYEALGTAFKLPLEVIHSLVAEGRLETANGEVTMASIDGLLEATSSKFTKPLTWATLQQGADTLLTAPEVCETFELSQNQLSRLHEHPEGPAFLQLDEQHVLYSLAFLSAIPGFTVPLLTLREVGHILGLSKPGVSLRIEAGQFRTMFNPRRTSCLHLLRDDVIAFLETGVLPPWVPAEEWMERRSNESAQLVSSQDTQKLFGTPNILPLLREKRAYFINLGPKSKILVCPQWLSQQDARGEPYTAAMVAELFDATEEEVETWENAGLIVCPLHEHDSGSKYLNHFCWKEIINTSSSPASRRNAEYFITQRRGAKKKLFTPQKAGEYLSLSVDAVIALAEEGVLWGVQNPAGEWRFTAHQVNAYKGRRLQELFEAITGT